MENASKALIIAGAILLAIVIISLGLIVVNNVRSTTDNTNLSEQEVQAFNAKFTAYEGTSVSGSRVNTLIQQVIATNQDTIDAGKTNIIAIKFPSISGADIVLTARKDDSKKWQMYWTASTNATAVRNNAVKADDTAVTTAAAKKNSLSVATGSTYKVEVEYIDGIIQIINVSAN